MRNLITDVIFLSNILSTIISASAVLKKGDCVSVCPCVHNAMFERTMLRIFLIIGMMTGG